MSSSKPSLFARTLRYMGMTTLDQQTMRATYANEDSKFFPCDGNEIHYRVEGRTDSDAPVLVMLHGIMASLHTWDGWVKELKEDYKIVRIDVPAFGLTGAIANGRYEVERIGDKINALLEHLKLGHFSLVGSSLGGYISWELAAKHPSKVDSLILLDAAGYPMPLPWLMRLLTTPVLRHAIVLGTPRFMVNITLGDVYGDRSKITDNAVQYYHDMMLARGNRQSLIRLFEELEHMTAERVKQVKAPTLIIWGDKDRWIPPANAKLFARDIPKSEVIMYPGVGHIPMEEIPQQSAADAHQFLSRVLTKPTVSKPKKEALSAN